MDNRPVIFFDTDFIKGVNAEDPHWIKLLQKSRNEEIKIITHKIVIDEWKSQALELYEKTSNKINSIHANWGNATKSYKFLNHLEIENPYRVIISDRSSGIEDTLRSHLINGIDRFVSEFKVQVLKIESDDVENVFTKYFEKKLPFINHSHKGHIPDAFIIEGMLSQKNITIYYFCNDANIIKTLLQKEYNIEKNQIFNADNFSEIPILKSTEYTNKSQLKVTPSSKKILKKVPSTIKTKSSEEKTLKEIYEEGIKDDYDIMERIAGYVHGFLGLNKSKIIYYLHKIKQWEDSKIEICIDKMIEMKVIKKIGEDIYIPLDKELCEKAYKSIQNDIIDLMEEGNE